MNKWKVIPANENRGVYIKDEVTGETVCDFYWCDQLTRALFFYPNAEDNAREIVDAHNAKIDQTNSAEQERSELYGKARDILDKLEKML